MPSPTTPQEHQAKFVIPLPLLLLLACVVIILNFLITEPWPLVGFAGRLDNAVYLLGGAEWAHGYLPYSHFWDNKPPSIYLLNAIAWKLSGGPTGIWLISLVCSLASILLFFSLCRRLYGEWPAVIATIFIFCALLPNDAPNVVNNFIVFFSLLSFGVVMNYVDTSRRPFMTGICLGLIWSISFLFRPNAVLFQSALVLLAVISTIHKKTAYNFIALAAGGLIGAFIYLAPIFLYFWTHHALPAMLDCLVRFNSAYVSGRAIEHVKAFLYGIPIASGGNVPLLFCAFVWATTFPRGHNILEWRILERALPFLLLGELLLGSAAGRQYSDYYEPSGLVAAFLVAFLSATIASRIPVHFESLSNSIRRPIEISIFIGLIAPAALIFFTANFPVLEKGFWFNHPVKDIKTYLQQHPGNGQIFVWGNRPGAYLLPGATADVPFSFVLPFFVPKYVNGELVGRLINYLDTRKPEYIFDLSPTGEVPPLSDYALASAHDADGLAASPPLQQIYAYVARYYRPLPSATNSKFIVYQRIAP